MLARAADQVDDIGQVRAEGGFAVTGQRDVLEDALFRVGDAVVQEVAAQDLGEQLDELDLECQQGDVGSL